MPDYRKHLKGQINDKNHLILDKSKYFTKNSEYPLAVVACGYTECGPLYYVGNPNIQNYSIEYVIKGKCSIRENDTTSFPKSGDSYVIHPGSFQELEADPSDPSIKLWVIFTGSLAEKLFDAYNLNEQIYYKGLNLQKPLEKICSICNSELSETEIMSSCSVVIMELIQKLYMYNQKNPGNSVNLDTADTLKLLIDKTWQANVSLQTLANKIYCSRNHAIHIFKEKFGITPYKYVQEVRLRNAKVLLESSNLSIGEISQSLRFCDSKYFANWFKKSTGLSPREYRNSFEENKNKKSLEA